MKDMGLYKINDMFGSSEEYLVLPFLGSICYIYDLFKQLLLPSGCVSHVRIYQPA